MKKMLIGLLAFMMCGTLAAQDLTALYRGGEVTLRPDPTFGSGNNWEELFSDFESTAYGKPVGTYHSLAVADNGTVFVSNYGQHSVYKFAADGRFVTEFGSEGWNDGQFANRPTIGGVLDNQYVLTTEYNGRVNVFDLGGRFVKLIQLEYMPLKCVALRDGRFAVIGHVPWQGAQVRNIVSLVDVHTEEEQIIYSEITSPEDSKMVRVKDGEMLVSLTNPADMVTRFIAATPAKNLVFGSSNNTEIKVFSPYGDQISSVDLKIERLPVTDEIRDEYVSGVESTVKERDLPQELIDAVRKHDFFPDDLPYYYDLLVDSDGNMLVFVYTETADATRFQVYTFDRSGKLLCETGISSDDYVLDFTHRFNSLEFHNGNLYGVLAPKKPSSTPVKLLKMTLIAK